MYSKDWYCVDMEYNQKETRIGRFDIIAISKKPDENNKHRVALIELKVGKESYDGSPKLSKKKPTPQELKQFNSQLALVFEKKDEIFSPASNNLRFGSGIVSHIADFLRYLPADGNQPLSYQTMLAEEIPKIIKCQIQFGCPVPKEILEIDKENLAIKPEVVFLCYTNSSIEKETIVDLKNQFGKYIFSSVKFGKKVPKYPLENTINNSNVSSFLSEDFVSFLQDPESKTYSISQDILGRPYSFSFVFVDSRGNDSLGCLDWLA